MTGTARGSLGELLRGYRRRAGLTQEEVANLAAVSVAALRDIEQGRVATPRAATLRRLGAVLGLSTTEQVGLARPQPATCSAGRAWIGVLGPLVVRVDNENVDPGSELQRALLGLLALSPNTPVPRERLLARVAAAGRPATVGALAARMSRLRRRLRPVTPLPGRPAPAAGDFPLVRAVDGGYELRLEQDQLDLLTFHSLVRQARRHQATGECTQAWEGYAHAVRLWRGEPLSGLALLADDPAVVALMRQWPPVAAEFAAVGSELGRHDDVVPVLRRVVAMDPLHEVAHARLMVALAGTGRQAEALEVFDTLRRRLDRDLGTTPGPDLVRSYRRVLRQEVAPQSAAAPRAYHTLPADLPGFTGRETELDWLQARAPSRPAGQPASHPAGAVIIAIEGAAGVGKSRLATHFAHQLVAAGRYAAQQLYADLAGPAGPAEILATFLQLLGVPYGQVPDELSDRVALYRKRLAATPALVLLDHATDSAQVAPLSPESVDTLTLVTSRDRIDLPCAHRLRLDRYTRPEAVEALTTALGAARVKTSPAAAERLLAATGRLPLAVALVTAWLQSRPVWSLEDAAVRFEQPLARLRREHPLSGPGRYGFGELLRAYLGEAL